MRWFRLLSVSLASVALLGLVIASGCSHKKNKEEPDDGPEDGAGPGTKVPVKVVDVKEYATIKGRVEFDGKPPARDPLSVTADKEYCMEDKEKDSFEDPAWKVGKDNGVENVAIFVEAPKGSSFPPPPDGKKPFDDSTVVVDQPYCAFRPHVAMVRPGQELQVWNSALIFHNTKYSGPTGDNLALPPIKAKGDTPIKKPIKLKPDAKEPVTLQCNAHPWMRGYVWASNTPYAAVTDENGNFEIKNVPAGTPVRLVVWHEKAGFCGKGGKEGETVTFKAGTDEVPVIKIK